MLTEELQVTARTLGEALQASEPVQKYLKALAEFQADPEAADLEKRTLAMYEELIARQQRGEMLQRSEIDDFNTLKRQVYQHPRITEREAALTPVKRYFAEIADEINLPLGVEFSTLAQAFRA
jgi:cell fate (sporulation/competence/biofilm development) regulator YlbF (YheA/YmcA/DUF963 family)